MMSKIVKLTTYSKTKVNESLVWMMSWSVTIFACLKPRRSDASLIAVKGVPSSTCNRISLSATTLLVKLKESKLKVKSYPKVLTVSALLAEALIDSGIRALS